MYLCALTAILSTFVQCDGKVNSFIFNFLLTFFSHQKGSVKLVSLPIETESIEGLSHIMFCNLLQGTKPVYFEWTIDGKPLMNRSSSVIKVENQETFSLLKIRNLKRNHSAVYTCYGKNGRSMDSTSTRLIVHGRCSLLLSIDYCTIHFFCHKAFIVSCSFNQSKQNMMFTLATIDHHCAIIGDNDDNGGNEH